jgi:hypothetical protein
MPRPVYIVVAKDIVEDKSKNFLSIFSVVEIVNLTVGPDRPDLDPEVLQELNESRRRAYEFTTVAVWMREAGDDDAQFEHQFAIVLPDHEDLLPAAPFQFDVALPLQRFRLIIQGIPAPEESCTINVESRVRRVETGQQWSQRYPIICTVRQLQDQPERHGNTL